MRTTKFRVSVLLICLVVLSAFTFLLRSSAVGAETQQNSQILLDSRIFNWDFYVNYHSDLKVIKEKKNWGRAEAVSHFLKHGIKEGRRASLSFAVKEYQALYEDAANLSYEEAIRHYLNVGYKEQRAGLYVLAPEVFSVRIYKHFNADVEGLSQSAAIDHWLTAGITEGRRASMQFSVKEYAARYPGLAEAFKSQNGQADYYKLTAHYMAKGRKESRSGLNNLLPADWYALHTEKRISDALVEEGDRMKEFLGADDKLVRVVVKQPKIPQEPKVITLDYNRKTPELDAVPENVDAYPVFKELFSEVAKARKAGAPYSIIDIPKGRYVFESGELPGAYFNIYNLEDVIIRGNSSVLVFKDLRKNGFRIHSAKRLKIENLELEWEGDLAVLGEIKGQGDKNVLILDNNTQPFSENIMIDQIALYDRKNGTWVGKPEFDFSESRELSKDETGAYHDPVLNTLFKEGDSVIARLKARNFFPNGIVFPKSEAEMSEDVSLSGLTFRNVPGMVILASYVKRGILIENTTLEKRAGALMSASKDGIHIGNTEGDIIIEKNSVGFQGDDGINIAPQSGRVMEISGNEVVVRRPSGDQLVMRKGDTLAFADEGMGYLGSGIVQEDSKTEKEHARARLDSLPKNLTPAANGSARAFQGSFARNVSLSPRRVYVAGNAFHDNRGRGIVIKVANGFYENNAIKNTTAAGILLTSDEQASFGYFEGHGVSNVIVRSNTIQRVGRGTRIAENSPAISVVGILDRGNGSVLSAQYPVIQSLSIEKNTVSNSTGPCMIIASALSVRITGNSCSETNIVKKKDFVGFHTLSHQNLVLNSRKVTFENNSFDQSNSVAEDKSTVLPE